MRATNQTQNLSSQKTNPKERKSGTAGEDNNERGILLLICMYPPPHMHVSSSSYACTRMRATTSTPKQKCSLSSKRINK
jgi:hypothetical protein